MLKYAMRIVEERDNLATAVEMGYVSLETALPDLNRLERELRQVLPTAV